MSGCRRLGVFVSSGVSYWYIRALSYYLGGDRSSIHQGSSSGRLVRGYDQYACSLRSLPIPLPSLPIQRRIAEILGRLDDKIEVNRRINRTLEAMAQALYRHWFVDFGPFQDGEFVESEVGVVPKGWEVNRWRRLPSDEWWHAKTKVAEYWDGVH